MYLDVIATIIFVNFHILEASSVLSSEVPVRMSSNEYNEMIAFEGYIELLQLNYRDRKKKWNQKTRKYFRRALACPIPKQRCLTPFVLCESTTGTSAMNRRNVLLKKMLERSPKKKRHLMQINDLPFFNTNEKTCFFASMTPQVARKVATQSCEIDEKKCLIHSVMPMMKIAAGCVSDVSDQVQMNGANIIVMGELSPYYKTQRHNIDLKSFVDEVTSSTMNKQHCKLQLEDTFSRTFSSISCEHSANALDVQSQWMGSSSIAFYITPPATSEVASIITRDRVLAFIAGLAVQVELVSIEVVSSYYYYY